MIISMKRGLIVALWMHVFVAASASAATWFVNRDASGTQTGTSWPDAFTDIQSAVTAASGDGGGEVWVAAGTYTSTAAAVLTMAPNVHIYGGFAGAETARSERNWKTNVATLDGEMARRCVVGANSATLDGFTLTQGSLSGNGGGMLNDGVSPTVENCLFTQNTVSGDGLTEGRGAGMYNANGAAPVVRNGIFTGNEALGDGGAICSYQASPQIVNCIFHDNRADTGDAGYCGGAVSNAESPAIVTNCLFYRNTAQKGGALANYKSAAIITNGTFTRNTADYSEGPAGGGAFNSADSPTDPAPTYVNCILWGNTQMEGDFADANTTSTVTYSDVRYGWAGTGNIDVNPRFVALATDDFHLKFTSLCIDVGNNGAVTALTDLDGRPRQTNTVDMGAYEYFAIQVTEVSPHANALNVPLSTGVTARVDKDLGAVTATSRVFSLHSGMTPFLTGTNVSLTYDGANPFVLSLDPLRSLHAGERVTASVYSADFPMQFFNWEFIATVSPLSSGNFLDSGQQVTSAGSRATAVGDLDADGDLDAFVLNSDGPCSVWMNDGNGWFADSQQSVGGSGGRDVALGDVDADGDLDAFVVGDGVDNILWLNDGSGVFTYAQAVGNYASRAAALADMDGDGDLDALIAISGMPIALWVNNSGTFSDSGQTLGAWGETTNLVVGDLDGDGSPDIFRTSEIVDDEVILNRRDGGFSSSGQSMQGIDSTAAALGDLDGDGDLDIFVAKPSGSIVWLNDGSASFTDSGQVLLGGASTDVALGDVDGDGDLDAFVTNGANGVCQVWKNNGAAVFTDAGIALAAEDSRSVALGDVNGDGALDAFTSNGGGANHVWLNTSEPIVMTNPATAIQLDSVTLNGYVTNAGSPAVNERGFYWDTDLIDTANLAGVPKVTITPDPGGTGAFSAPLGGLSSGTQYHFVAYAANGVNTVFGAKRTFLTKAVPVVSWDEPAAIAYGESLGTAQLNATANTPGEFAYNPASGTVLTAGSHVLQVEFTPNDDVHYTNATATVNLTVNKAVATVSFNGLSFTSDGTPKPVAVTTTPPGLDVMITYDGLSDPPSEPGEYAVVATIQDANYQGQATGTLRILEGLRAIGTGGLRLLLLMSALAGVRAVYRRNVRA